MLDFISQTWTDIRFAFRTLAKAPGFATVAVLAIALGVGPNGAVDPLKRAAFARSVMRRVEVLPGVRSASTIDVLPMRSYFLNLPANVRQYQIEGQTLVPSEEQPNADYRIVNRSFLGAMGVRLVRGRKFSQHDDESAPNVVMVNETLARRCCPGEDVIGKHIRIAGRVRAGGFHWRSATAIADRRARRLCSSTERDARRSHGGAPLRVTMVLRTTTR